MSNKKKEAESKGSSAAKPLGIIALGLLGALAIALFLSRSEAEAPPSETTVTLPAAERVRGPEDAPVHLVEFGDYQCPTCGAFHPIVTELMRRFPTELQFEYRHLPLVSIHPNALNAAVAAEAAGLQGHYWEMHDMLYEYQSVWSAAPDPKPIFAGYAERIGLDVAEFRRALDNDSIQAPILADVREANTLGLGGTPSFFVNGRLLANLPRSGAEFEAIIREALAAAE